MLIAKHIYAGINQLPLYLIFEKNLDFIANFSTDHRPQESQVCFICGPVRFTNKSVVCILHVHCFLVLPSYSIISSSEILKRCTVEQQTNSKSVLQRAKYSNTV